LLTARFLADIARKIALYCCEYIIIGLCVSTEGKDRIKKAHLYHACPTIQEYVLISTRYQAVEVQRRTGDEWTLHVFGPGDEIELTSIDVRFPLAMLYRGTSVVEMLNGGDE
jgi:Uma2 family endonuclease